MSSRLSTAPAALAPGEHLVQSLHFEALFVRGLQVDAALAADLRAAGFDLAQQQVRYPERVFKACVDAAHRRLYPGQREAEAHRELGRIFMRGFRTTLLGKVICAMLPLMGPVRLLGRMPEYLRLGDAVLTVKVETLGQCDYRLDCTHSGQTLPYLVTGIVEEALLITSTTATLEPRVLSPTRFELRVRW